MQRTLNHERRCEGQLGLKLNLSGDLSAERARQKIPRGTGETDTLIEKPSECAKRIVDLSPISVTSALKKIEA